jgi:alpha-L-glutamate ligase-like protein
MLGLFKTYRDLGILGMNSRNVDYILKYNPRAKYPLVDDKLLTKDLAEQAGIPTPPIYEVIRFPSDTIGFADRIQAHAEFVVKPAQGSGGGGIIVIGGRTNRGFRRSSGRIMSFTDMRYHLTNTLSGLYSLGGQPDQAIVQYRVHPDPFFAPLTTNGVPDVRVIVFRGVPVMAMLRLPTQESDGKANLHAGGIGTGVSVATGMTTHGVYRNTAITEHPDTYAPIAGHVIPAWDQILNMAAQFCDLTGLGYIGVDIVIDRDQGPMMLEVNARPGIAIQVANQKGLKARLELVEQHIDRLPTLADKIAFAKERFN